MQDMIAAHPHRGLIIWPSHDLLPEYFAGDRYEGPDEPYASHQWGTTMGTYPGNGRAFGGMVRQSRRTHMRWGSTPKAWMVLPAVRCLLKVF